MVVYGVFVYGFVIYGDIEVAFDIRKKMMERGVIFDIGIYNVIMSGLFKKGMFFFVK